MKKSFNSLLAILGVAALVMTSCDQLPQAEVDAATAAVSKADSLEAAIYVPGEYAALQDSMKAAQAQLEADKSKFFKNYDGSRAKFSAILTLASTVGENSVARKAAVSVEIDSTIAQVTALLVETRALLEKAPKGKEGASVLEAMAQELSSVETSVATAQNSKGTGSLLPILDTVKAAKEKVTGIKTELEAVIEKYQASRKARK